LAPVAGAVAQEGIDLLAVLNALRTARQPAALPDFDPSRSPIRQPATLLPPVGDQPRDRRLTV
jgi:hypothetical protein